MFGILLGVKKSTLVKIVRGFATSANVRYSLQEVIESWLEMKHNPQRPHSLATIQDVVQRMGNEALARDLGELCIATLHCSSNFISSCLIVCKLDSPFPLWIVHVLLLYLQTGGLEPTFSTQQIKNNN